MSFSDYRMCIGWMEGRLAEAERSATDTKLRREYGRPARGWLAQRSCRTLCGLGRILVAAGEGLQRYAVPQAVRFERNAG